MLRQRTLAKLKTTAHFLDRVAAAVLVLNVGRNVPALVPEHREHRHDVGVSLTPDRVLSLITLTVLQVQCDDLLMMVAQIRHGVVIRRAVVTNVEVDRDRRTISLRHRRGELVRG